MCSPRRFFLAHVYREAGMSDYVYSRHGGELVLAERAADERAVMAALRDLDDRLRLTWEVDQRTGRQVWNVVYVWSQEHPAQQILTWRENGAGDPMPLTWRLIDEVKRIRQHDTVKQADIDNARLREQADRQVYEDALAVTSEFERLDRTGRIHIPHRVGSNRLAAAKRRGRAGGRSE